MKQLTIWIGILAVVIAGWYFLTIKNPDGQKQVSVTASPIKIGAMLSLTGIASAYGEVSKNAIDMAMDEINAKGGINGRKVVLYVEDDHTDPKQAISAFQKLVSVDKVDGVVGGMFDFATQPVFPIALSSKTAFITPKNFRIPGSFELNEDSFVMLPDFSKVIRELSGFIKENKTKKLAVVHFKSAFGQEIAKTLNAVMVESGMGPIADEPYQQIGNNDFKTTILKLKQQKVDTVFLDMVDVDPINFLTRARELGYKPTIISYEGIRDSFSGKDADKSLLEGVIILDWEFGPPQFTDNYRAKYGTEPVKAASKSYDAVYVLAQAIEKSAGHDDVVSYIVSHQFETPYGVVSFNKDHAVDSTPVRIEIIKDGQLVGYVASSPR